MTGLPPVYPITSTEGRDWSHIGCARALLAGGARLIQVRDKHLSDGALFEQLCTIRDDCRRVGALVLVNDRVDVALAAGCDGVHLGQEDLGVAEARRLLGPRRVVGLSTHDREQFKAAQQADVDYVAIGPVYPTSSKPGGAPPVGEEEVKNLLAAARRPTVAIGGITLERARRLWRIGVDAVAVISDIVGAPDPSARVKEYLEFAAT